MARPDWVAEHPDAHLLPHLERGSTALLQVVSTRSARDGVFEVKLAWSGEPGRHDDLRSAVFSLIGTIAEGATAVVQRPEAGATVFEVTTGMLDDQTHFKSHGHLVRLVVEPPEPHQGRG